MIAPITAMITAIVGVLGTLCAPLLTQRLSERRDRERSAAEERHRFFEERRSAYSAMNRASREFDTVLKDALHRLRDGVYTEQDRAEVEIIRRAYRDQYAAAQMIVPERVLAASRALNRVLAEADAAAKRLDRGSPHDGETAEGALDALKEAEPGLHALTQIMREDLGVTS